MVLSAAVLKSATWSRLSRHEHGSSQVVLVVKNPPTNAGDIRDASSISGLGRCPGGENGHPLQYSCLENPMDRGAWRATVHGAARVGHCSRSSTASLTYRRCGPRRGLGWGASWWEHGENHAHVLTRRTLYPFADPKPSTTHSFFVLFLIFCYFFLQVILKDTAVSLWNGLWLRCPAKVKFLNSKTRHFTWASLGLCAERKSALANLSLLTLSSPKIVHKCQVEEATPS